MFTEESLNKFRTGSLEEVNSVLEEIQQKWIENVLITFPHAIMNLMKYSKTVSESIKDFYTNNPELAKDKELAASVAQLVESENPGSDIEVILAKVKQKLEGTV
jgi:hypothetical protein